MLIPGPAVVVIMVDPESVLLSGVDLQSININIGKNK